jgi:hypothetical protein
VLLWESDYSAGVGGAGSASGVTLAGNVDSIGGEDDWLSLTATSAGSGRASVSGITTIPAITARAGTATLWEIEFKLFKPASNTRNVLVSPTNQVTTTRFTVVSLLEGPDVFNGAIAITTDAIVTVKAIVSLPLSSYTTLQSGISAWIAAGGAGGEILYFKAGTFKQLGLTSELIASNAQSNTGQILDSSGNKNHALLPASGATVVGRPVSQTREVRWTNTWDGTNELQYIGGVNQAILPANAYIESIVGTVSGATPHDIIVGDGSDTNRYVTITTGLAAGTTSFTLANQTTDGTNLKLTVDPDTDATMSIAWVISYKTLES